MDSPIMNFPCIEPRNDVGSTKGLMALSVEKDTLEYSERRKETDRHRNVSRTQQRTQETKTETEHPENENEWRKYNACKEMQQKSTKDQTHFFVLEGKESFTGFQIFFCEPILNGFMETNLTHTT